MIVSIHQPAYIPWLGYFDKIKKSDIFVYLDTVQFEKNSFINRNKIKTPMGDIFLTVPVKLNEHKKSSINLTEIDYNRDWITKHLRSIYINYKKSKNFDYLYPKIENLYSNKFKTISELCFYQLNFFLEEMDYSTKIVKASDLVLKNKKSDLVLEICQIFNANIYISGIMGKSYLNESTFEKNGIDIIYQNFEHPIYDQLYGDFIPNLSIIDFLMNNSKE